MNIEIPPFLKRSLDEVPEGAPFVVLVRHADREHIKAGEFGRDCPLTSVGERRARLLGSVLGSRLTSARSSPLLRCEDTVRRIAEGAERPIEPVPDPALGQPGAFVHDRVLAGPVFLERTTEQVVYELLAGARLPGIRGLEEGSRILLGALAAAFPSEECCVCVSHDAIVLPFLYWATGGAFPSDEWLSPLDGCIALREQGRLQIVWNGISFDGLEGPC